MIFAARTQLKSLVFAALMGAILVAGQVVMSALPNIEPVSLLVVMYTLMDRRLARWAIAVFILLQGLIYGFHIWWFTYLYVWYVLHVLVLLTQKWAGTLFLALLSGAFGLFFGTLTSIPYFVTLGINGGLAYVVAGIPFDLSHAAGNFILMLLLYRPLRRVFEYLGKMLRLAPPAVSGDVNDD